MEATTPIPITFADDLLTYQQCAIEAKVSAATISNWAHHPRRSLRLQTVDLGHRTKRVRRVDWNGYMHSRLNPLNHK